MLCLLLTTQEAVKHFGPEGGNIVNISSGVATLALPNVSVYNATKTPVDAITKTLAKALGPRKVRVNLVNQGMVETDGLRSAGIHDSDFRQETELQTPLGRIGQAHDIAPAVVFLASPDSGWLTGETLTIAGGMK